MWGFRGAGPAAVAAALLGLSACATTQGPGGRVGAPLSEAGGPPAMSQLEHPDVKLGTGRFTIASSGCFLTSLTMASAMLHGRRDLDPVLANRMVQRNGGFRGSALDLEQAAPALGLEVVHRETLTAANPRALDQRLDAALADGKPVVMGVDFQPGRTSGYSDADHFIVVYARLGEGRYRAVDPAGGVRLELLRGDDGVLRQRAQSTHRITEMLFLDRDTFARDPAAFRAAPTQTPRA